MPPKRKRPERGDMGGGRPSPHRPGDTQLGQHDRDYQDFAPRPPSRPSGRMTRRSDRRDSRDGLPPRMPLGPSATSPTSPVRQPPSNATSSSSYVAPSSHGVARMPSSPP